MEKNETYLTEKHELILKKICIGCRYYNPKINVKDICSIIGWYVDVVSGQITFETFLEYVKGCPCNQKCLVKASCIDENCPMWMKHVTTLGEKRIDQLRKYLWKEKRSKKS